MDLIPGDFAASWGSLSYFLIFFYIFVLRRFSFRKNYFFHSELRIRKTKVILQHPEGLLVSFKHFSTLFCDVFLFKKNYFFHSELRIKKTEAILHILKTSVSSHWNSLATDVFGFSIYAFSMQILNSEWLGVRLAFLSKSVWIIVQEE